MMDTLAGIAGSLPEVSPSEVASKAGAGLRLRT
jgi:hypothetical protein